MKQFLQRFIQLESSSAIVLFATTIVAIIWTNSPLAFIHQQFNETFLFFINEGLMAVFFLQVGLELKRGFVEGQLREFSAILLPAVAALGGMIVPALIYISINFTNPITIKAWSTPVATDIAFALGVLSLFGRCVSLPLKLFLLTLAIFDDIGAIIIIALFYSHGISYLFLLLSLCLFLLLSCCHYLSLRYLSLYFFLGILLWLCLWRSGIHPTIAGVLLALTIPSDETNKQKSLLHRLEKTLHPWVAYFIMPLFAFANAGVSLHGISSGILFSEVVLGIVSGLFLGKQIGIMVFSWILIKLKWAKLPLNTSWLMLYGVALLCGIGFTMSLFLGTLSFQNENVYLAKVRLGVIIGSILSSLVGAYVLKFAFARSKTKA